MTEQLREGQVYSEPGTEQGQDYEDSKHTGLNNLSRKLSFSSSKRNRLRKKNPRSSTSDNNNGGSHFDFDEDNHQSTLQTNELFVPQYENTNINTNTNTNTNTNINTNTPNIADMSLRDPAAIKRDSDTDPSLRDMLARSPYNNGNARSREYDGAPLSPDIDDDNATVITGDLGIGTKPSPRRIRRKKDPTPFNILIAGCKGSGKTTFIKYLKSTFDAEYATISTKPQEKSGFSQSNTIVKTAFDAEIDGERVAVSLWDSNGFGPSRERGVIEIQSREIIRFIEDQFELTFSEENKINRQNAKQTDTHIHCIIYLLDPTTTNKAGLDTADLQILSRLSSKSVVLPVIAKADTVTTSDMARLKKSISSQLIAIELDPLNFLDNENFDKDDLDSEKEHYESFSVLSGVNGEGRDYPWGTANPLNIKHCDFIGLKASIFEEWRSEIRTWAREFAYENWRTKRLSMLKGVKV